MKWLYITLCGLLLTIQAYADPVVVKVGAYEFPPYFSVNRSLSTNLPGRGAAVDLVEALNRLQDDFLFEIFPTSPKRRYLDFLDKRYDVIFFESMLWGWEDFPVEASKVFMGGGEVYVALKKPERDQTFFDDLKQRNLVGVLGYHYGFADFNAEDEFLSNNFRIFLSSDHERNLTLVLADRPLLAEVAVVTRSYLNLYLRKHPGDREKFLVSDRYDQIYRHTILSRQGGPVGAMEFNRWLDQLEANGDMQAIRLKYGLEASQ